MVDTILKARSVSARLNSTMTTHNLLRNQKGFTIAELLVVIAITLIVSAMAAYNLKELSNPLQNSTAEIVGMVKQAKTKAIYTSSAYKIHAPDNQNIVASFAKSCSDTDFETDTTMSVALDKTTQMKTSGWTFCFSPRGLADQYHQILIKDKMGKSRLIEIFRGGAIRRL